jgi:hypothetical protein
MATVVQLHVKVTGVHILGIDVMVMVGESYFIRAGTQVVLDTNSDTINVRRKFSGAQIILTGIG